MKKNLFILVSIFCIQGVYAQYSITTMLSSSKIEVQIAPIVKIPDTLLNVSVYLEGCLCDPVYDYVRNDFELSLGTLSNQIYPVSFSYYKRLKRWFWLGGTLNYISNASEPLYFSKINDLTFVGIAPAIRFSYLNKRKVMLYSGIAVGAAISCEEILPYFQATAIGFSYSFNRKYCYLWGSGWYVGVELGFGFKGTLNLNIGYRFHKLYYKKY